MLTLEDKVDDGGGANVRFGIKGRVDMTVNVQVSNLSASLTL